MKGLLIAFDGLDSTGKATQVRELGKRLEHNGHRVHHWQTPDYTTPSGQQLKLRLQGKLGDWHATPWEEKMRYFSANRAEHKDEVLAALAAGDIVIYDRYVQSSVAFMTVEAGLVQEMDLLRQKVQAAVRHDEYDTHGMPHEHVSIFLDVPPAVAVALLNKRKDQHQEDDEYTDHISVQERLYNEYDLMMAAEPARWLRIACTEGSELLPIAAVSELVWEGLIRRFPALQK
jgi:dTMP kinase